MDKNQIWQITTKTLYFDFLRFLAINFINRLWNWNSMVNEIAIFDCLKGSQIAVTYYKLGAIILIIILEILVFTQGKAWLSITT